MRPLRPSLRPALAADYAVLASWLPDAQATLRWAGPRVRFPFSPAELAAQVQVEGSRSYALEADGTLVAFGQHWVVEAPAVHLGRLIVAPDQRGKGYGRELCVQLIGAALAITGATSVTLRVYRDNAAAVALYLGLGFREEAAASDDVALFMRRALG